MFAEVMNDGLGNAMPRNVAIYVHNDTFVQSNHIMITAIIQTISPRVAMYMVGVNSEFKSVEIRTGFDLLNTNWLVSNLTWRSLDGIFRDARIGSLLHDTVQ